MRKLLVPLIAAVVVLVPMQAAHASSKYTVSLSLSTSSVTINGYVTLTGKVSPTAKKKTVTIERLYAGGTWKKVASTKTASSSKFTKKVKLTKAGPTFFRVRKASGSGHSAGTSSSRNISVFRWRYLQGLPNTSTPSFVYEGPAEINGYAFHNSFSLKHAEQVRWDLAGKQCTKLVGYIGVDDDSVAGTTAYALVTDQDSTFYAYEQGLARGQSPRWIHANLTGPNLLFIPNVTASTTQAWVTYGDMQVYCNS